MRNIKIIWKCSNVLYIFKFKWGHTYATRKVVLFCLCMYILLYVCAHKEAPGGMQIA
jgi:hypothetical protein